MTEVKQFNCIVCKQITNELIGGMCKECKENEDQRKRDLTKHHYYSATDPTYKYLYLFEYKGNKCRRCDYNGNTEALVFVCNKRYKTLGIKNKTNRTMKSLIDMLEGYHLYCRDCFVILSKDLTEAKKEKKESKYKCCKHCDKVLKLNEQKYDSCIGCFVAKNSHWIHYQLVRYFGEECKTKKCKIGKYSQSLVIYDKENKQLYDILSVDSYDLGKKAKELQIEGYDIYCHHCMYEHRYDGESEPVDMIC